MRTLEEIYEELQNADNNELNIAWQEAKKESQKAKKIIIIICLIIDIFAILLLKSRDLFSVFLIIMFASIINILVAVMVNILFSKNKNKYKAKYKELVISKLISNFYNHVEYFPQKPMPEYIYEKLQYEHYDNYKSEDYFEGYIDDKYSIQMAEVLTEDIDKYKDSEGETHTRIITKFHGLFAKVLMEKSIKSEIQIMQNGTFLFNKKLEMDSSEFEKHFDVKASDKIIGMQLLTADVMEELVQFEKETKMKFDIYIKGNELYLRYHSEEMFEPGNFKNNALDKENIRKYFYMLNFTYNLSKKLINVVNETQI